MLVGMSVAVKRIEEHISVLPLDFCILKTIGQFLWVGQWILGSREIV